MLLGEVDLHAVSHVEDLVHLCPVGAALLLDCLEQRRDGEQIVLDDTYSIDEVQHLGLCPARAMHHAVDVVAMLVEHPLDDRGVSACGRQHQTAGIDGTALDGIGQAQMPRVDQVLWDGMVIAFGVFVCQISGKDIMARAGQPVAAHATVVFFFISCLSE